jgi:hypothetical protein
MQHLEGSGRPVLDIGHTVLKGGYAVAQLVEALPYKPEFAGSIPYCVNGISH